MDPLNCLRMRRSLIVLGLVLVGLAAAAGAHATIGISVAYKRYIVPFAR